MSATGSGLNNMSYDSGAETSLAPSFLSPYCAICSSLLLPLSLEEGLYGNKEAYKYRKMYQGIFPF